MIGKRKLKAHAFITSNLLTSGSGPRCGLQTIEEHQLILVRETVVTVAEPKVFFRPDKMAEIRRNVYPRFDAIGTSSEPLIASINH